MKKLYILLFALLFSAGAVYAQNDDELLKKQQQEQQELLKQQQKEQERLAKEQAKEQEKAAKEEQDRVKREQAKKENDMRKKQKEAEKKAKRQENYAKWGRKPSFTADPNATILTDRRFYGTNNLFNAVGYNLGVVIDYHRPIAKRWDCNIGLGYRFTNYYYSHLDAGAGGFNGKEDVRAYNSIVLPMKLSHVNKDNASCPPTPPMARTKKASTSLASVSTCSFFDQLIYKKPGNTGLFLLWLVVRMFCLTTLR